MADNKRQTRVARPTPPDALALPHVVEAIATCLRDQADFSSYLHAVPRSLWTPALTAFLACNTTPPQRMALPPSVLVLLAATLPLRPRIELEFVTRDAARLASLVAVLGPSLSSVTIHLSSNGVANGRGRAMSDLLLQGCPHLRRVIISVVPRRANQLVELNDALGVVAHPHMDHDAVIAFCEALQASTTLRDVVSNVPSLGGFHGRTLPVSLIILDWESRANEIVDDATLTDLATAVGRTQLKYLVCNAFGQLATFPAAAPMLAQLQWLIVSGLHANDMKALIDGLSSVPSLTSLSLHKCSLSSSMELLRETLATTCVHLAKLTVRDQHPTRDG
ncbi:hypothetical protein SPRG_04322 [Saprolegnia parasitica CBS 223.65]|uniref:F-box domain-containing protein n=1 Tax=Saprolegnia parasitica (strain CBS 223.65) TaxID=695850 RepID=A0A067CIR0_SAPPC|nr:hypothetical protein SPRG_04322 [Saprolegnia parasitica CBS 223.65]KDO30408.1 hypothetical protein SPRG_04322 [Saprolegnia parasitica CBS 223.65]|eukprot:XP_012198643.1 hypothetical protein SPRG_04322 [Saprolegnia parasitica CBS 223.65]